MMISFSLRAFRGILVSFWLLAATSECGALPLKGKNIEDVGKDIGDFPISFSLQDENGNIRFEILSRGALVATQAVGQSKGETEIVVALISEKEWHLQTYKRISKSFHRMLPVKTDSGMVLRVWTSFSLDVYFDIDLDFEADLKLVK